MERQMSIVRENKCLSTDLTTILMKADVRFWNEMKNTKNNGFEESLKKRSITERT